jgi:hypothetical protein
MILGLYDTQANEGLGLDSTRSYDSFRARSQESFVDGVLS